MPQNPTQEVHSQARADLTLTRLGAIGLAFAVGVAYFLAAKLSLALRADGVPVFWPAVGVSSGVLIALGRDALLPVVGGTMVATIVATLTGGQNVWGATAFALCDAGEALLTAWLIERYFGSDFSLDRLRNVLGLLAAAAVATAAAGVGGTAVYLLFNSPTAPIWTVWQHWFASDSIGIITVAPLVIGLAQAVREPPPRNEILEGIAALVALAVFTVIVVSLPPKPWQTMIPVALLFPILLWLAARCRPGFAAAAAFSVTSKPIARISAASFGYSCSKEGLDRLLQACDVELRMRRQRNHAAQGKCGEQGLCKLHGQTSLGFFPSPRISRCIRPP